MGRSRYRIGLLFLAVMVLTLAVWGPERLARYKDRATLNRVEIEEVEEEAASYRYTMSNNEKMYILSKCLNSQEVTESELSAMTRPKTENTYEEIQGTYAFVVNRSGSSEKEITGEEIFDICNEQLAALKELGILPDTVKKVKASAYNAVLYSAIDVLEPRNNLSVWKVSLSTSQQNADKTNRLLDAYIDADSGRIYEFYVRTRQTWEDIEPDRLIEKWSGYMGLEDMTAYEDVNPLMENTPYFKKYRFPGLEGQNTVVTLGFYEGINELFLKISK